MRTKHAFESFIRHATTSAKASWEREKESERGKKEAAVHSKPVSHNTMHTHTHTHTSRAAAVESASSVQWAKREREREMEEGKEDC